LVFRVDGGQRATLHPPGNLTRTGMHPGLRSLQVRALQRKGGGRVTTTPLPAAPPPATTAVDERALAADVFAGLCARPPATLIELAALITTIEALPQTEVRRAAAVAVIAERLAVEFGRSDLEMRARLVRADALQRGGDTIESGRLSQQVQAWAAENGNEYLLARSHNLLCTFFRQVGDAADALAHGVQSVAHSDQIPPATRARHLNALAVTLEENGSRDEAFRRFQEALDAASVVDDAELAIQVLNNMAFIRCEAGDEEAARDLVNRVRAVSTRHAVPMVANVLDTIARVEMMGGRYAEAEETLRPVTDGWADHLVTEGSGLAECLLTLAEAQRLRGDPNSCQATLDRAVRVCEASALASQRARVREQQAQLHAATGRYREAYEEHRRFYLEVQALQSAQREARARMV
jgi:tetratricopeptide (TPR) repeat protein